MERLEDNIRKVVPYIPGEQPVDSNVIKLNTNENPYPLLWVREALKSLMIVACASIQTRSQKYL